jgi:hypothetical protein
MKWPRLCLTAILLALTMTPVIYSIYFHISQQLIRKEMWDKMKGEVSDVVTIHPSKLYWMEEGREIFVNGLMFDVKSIEQVGDSLRITGEYDYEESGIHKELELVKESSRDDDQQAHSVQILVQVMDDSLFRFVATFSPIDLQISNHFPGTSILPTIYLDTIYPPPKA